MRLLLLLLVSFPAFAQDDFTLLGAGMRTRPTYDGSSERTAEIIPVVRYHGQPWFARTTQGVGEAGARWNLRSGLDAGVQLAYEQGPRDRNPGASIGAHIEWDTSMGPAPLNLLARLRQHVDTGRGLQLDARATAGVYAGHGILAGLFAQATWASTKYFEAYYGLRDSGLLYTSFGSLASYDLATRWMMVGSLEYLRLSDDAARSAIVSRRGGGYASLGLGYRF